MFFSLHHRRRTVAAATLVVILVFSVVAAHGALGAGHMSHAQPAPSGAHAGHAMTDVIGVDGGDTTGGQELMAMCLAIAQAAALAFAALLGTAGQRALRPLMRLADAPVLCAARIDGTAALGRARAGPLGPVVLQQ